MSDAMSDGDVYCSACRESHPRRFFCHNEARRVEEERRKRLPAEEQLALQLMEGFAEAMKTGNIHAWWHRLAERLFKAEVGLKHAEAIDRARASLEATLREHVSESQKILERIDRGEL